MKNKMVEWINTQLKKMKSEGKKDVMNTIKTEREKKKSNK